MEKAWMQMCKEIWYSEGALGAAPLPQGLHQCHQLR